jgi:hypothetical protein
MNNIEEQLWNYIDGNCTPDEQKNISSLIAGDEAWRVKYHELLNLNKEFSAIELDEPPMAFTYNIMEAIRTEHANVPLKSVINKRIIWGIAVFFVVTILALLVYIITNIKISAPNISFNAPANLKMPDIKNYISKPLIEAFFFFDVVLALFLSDAYLRTKKVSKHR